MPSPVLQPLENQCRRVGAVIGQVLDDHAEHFPESPRVGFCLMMFTFGEGGWSTFISNADRQDMIAGINELLSNLKEVS